MTVKYECPKCNKRFVEWGAKKLEFKCPVCTPKKGGEAVELVRIGTPLDPTQIRVPTLTRHERPVKRSDDDEESEVMEVEAEPFDEEPEVMAGPKTIVEDVDDVTGDDLVEDEEAEPGDAVLEDLGEDVELVDDAAVPPDGLVADLDD